MGQCRGESPNLPLNGGDRGDRAFMGGTGVSSTMGWEEQTFAESRKKDKGVFRELMIQFRGSIRVGGCRRQSC